MSSESLAALRKHAGDELAELAEQHMKHDLNENDREVLKSAASKFGFHTTLGSLIGLGVGLFLAIRVRNARTVTLNALRAVEKPTHVQFADGRLGRNLDEAQVQGPNSRVIEPLPDINSVLKPSALGDTATYLLFSAGGLFLGGELGMLTGTASARRSIQQDPESMKRITTAFRKFRADALRKEAQWLDSENSANTDILSKAKELVHFKE
ncbi:hypothetical protein IWX90DRAFT_446530 [Phyllosticta citrichinensis]|uniref:DUF3618 domain-containing protein n=1 Tax=Phyllosticta citrichinensis TaxID=1130410 RepID=A0ABR1XEV9_9PEZI